MKTVRIKTRRRSTAIEAALQFEAARNHFETGESTITLTEAMNRINGHTPGLLGTLENVRQHILEGRVRGVHRPEGKRDYLVTAPMI